MAINGNNILIYKNGTAIAGVKSDEVQTSVDTIEISSPSTGVWKQYIPGRKEWGVNVGYLVLADSGVTELLNVGSTYTLIFKGRNATGTNGIKGTAMLKVCKITATRGNLVQGSFQFIGTGALTSATS